MQKRRALPELAITPYEEPKKDYDDKRFRKMFRFWLDQNNPNEAPLVHYLADFKTVRKYHRLIRAALWLFKDLQEGRVVWLLHYFPDIQQRLDEHYREEG